MDEKDLSRMSDEELKEFIKRFYAELDKKPDCAFCPVTACPRRRSPQHQGNEEISGDDESPDRNQGSG